MADDEFHLRATDLAWRDVSGSVLVLDLRDSEYFELNQAGSVLWHRIAEGGADAVVLVQTLVDTFGIDASQAEDDVKVFVRSMEEAGFLES